MRIQFLLGEVGAGLRRNVPMIVSVVLVSMVSMFFLGAGLLAQREVSLAKGYWYDKVEVSIYLCTAQSTGVPSCTDGKATPAQRNQIRRDLDGMKPLVQRIYYESADQAYARFKQQFKNSPYLSQVGPDAMPASFRVKLSDPKRYGDIVNAFDGEKGVEAVSDQHNVLGTFFRLLNVISVGAVGLAVVMVVCAILLIATTIQQVAITRRRQVNIMRLVGASSTMIRLPFMIETILATLAGAALAIGLLWSSVHYGVARLFGSHGGSGDLISVISVGDVWSIAPWLGGGAFVLALVTSWLALRRSLRV